VAPVASKRRYGPPGRFSETGLLSTVKFALTALVVVLTATLSDPFSDAAAGSETAMLPENCPASPK
jgi:hypothetical protein